MPTPATLTAVRAVVAAYEAVVRHYPASGYSDNALWQAGRLALDAFRAIRAAAGSRRPVRLLHTLAARISDQQAGEARCPDELAR